MRGTTTALVALLGFIVTGCVASQTYKEAVTTLEKTEAQLAAEQERARQENERLTVQIAGLEEGKANLSGQLLAAQTAGSRTRAELETTKNSLAREQQARRESEQRLTKLQKEHEGVFLSARELRRERDQLRTTADDLQRQLDTAGQQIESGQQSLASAEARIASLDKSKADLEAALGVAQTEARDLGIQLAAQKENVARISEEKQRLMSGTTTAQEEIARLQRRAGELEAKAARADDLEGQLSERDQEIGQLRQAAADRASLAAKLGSLEQELSKSKNRVGELTAQLASVSAEAAQARQERDNALQEAVAKNAEIQRVALARRDLARSLEEERAAKQAEIERLRGTQAALNKSLRAEIEKGDIRIRQVRDRLTINMVDRVLFDSGRAEIKTKGLEVLKRVSEVLKQVGDKQIRIEGHTDNVPIGIKLREQFPSNWELSTARATSVVRYLIDTGDIEGDDLTAAGYADTRPVADNETPEGRQSNRRIEIVLYPKDLSEIIQDFQS